MAWFHAPVTDTNAATESSLARRLRSTVRLRPSRSEIGHTIRTGMPLSLAFLGQMLLAITDVLVLGRLGPEPVAAAGLGVAVYWIVFLFCLGMVLPAESLAAQARGRARSRTMRRIIRQSLWLAVAVCVPGWAVLWNMERLLTLFGQDPDLAAQTGVYMRWFMWGLLPYVLFMALRTLLVVLERPKWAVVVVWAAVALNVPLDLGLVLGMFGLPAMGLQGAGMASALVSLFMMATLALVVWLRPPFRRYAMFRRLWKFDRKTFTGLVRYSWPFSAQMTLEESQFSACALLIGLMGVYAVAAHTIAMNVINLCVVAFVGLRDVALSRTGQHAGRGDWAGAQRVADSGLAVALLGGCAVAAALALLAQPLASLFLEAEAAGADQVMAVATSLLVACAALVVFDVPQMVVLGALHGLRDMAAPALIATTGTWVAGFGGAALFGLALNGGPAGVWWGLVFGAAITTIALRLRFVTVMEARRAQA